MVATETTWHCLNCDERGEGDKAAEKHTKATQHGTCTHATPVAKR